MHTLNLQYSVQCHVRSPTLYNFRSIYEQLSILTLARCTLGLNSFTYCGDQSDCEKDYFCSSLIIDLKFIFEFLLDLICSITIQLRLITITFFIQDYDNSYQKTMPNKSPVRIVAGNPHKNKIGRGSLVLEGGHLHLKSKKINR